MICLEAQRWGLTLTHWRRIILGLCDLGLTLWGVSLSKRPWPVVRYWCLHPLETTPCSTPVHGFLWRLPGSCRWWNLSCRSWPPSLHCPGWVVLSRIGSRLRYLCRERNTALSSTDPGTAWSCVKYRGPCMPLVLSTWSLPWIPWGAPCYSIIILPHVIPMPDNSLTAGLRPPEGRGTSILVGRPIATTAPTRHRCLQCPCPCGNRRSDECDYHTLGRGGGTPWTGRTLPGLLSPLWGPPGISVSPSVHFAA